MAGALYVGWGLARIDLGQMGQKYFFIHKLLTTCHIFTNNPSFYSKFYDQQLTIFFGNFSCTWQLGPSLWVWGSKWAQNEFQNGFLSITWQPLVRFSQVIPHFIQNFMISSWKNCFLENFVQHGVWDLVCRFGANNGPQMGFWW